MNRTKHLFSQTWAILTFIFLSVGLLSSCGYHFTGPSSTEETTSISIPYVKDDIEGQLTDELIRAFASSGNFSYRSEGGQLELRVVINRRRTTPIGWRYQREVDGLIVDELIPVEGRLQLAVDVELLDSVTEETLFGPVTITALADYDYYETDVIQDLSFIDSAGVRQTSIKFSLGQLDSSEGAFDAAYPYLSGRLAKKIVDRILRASY